MLVMQRHFPSGMRMLAAAPPTRPGVSWVDQNSSCGGPAMARLCHRPACRPERGLWKPADRRESPCALGISLHPVPSATWSASASHCSLSAGAPPRPGRPMETRNVAVQHKPRGAEHTASRCTGRRAADKATCRRRRLPASHPWLAWRGGVQSCCYLLLRVERTLDVKMYKGEQQQTVMHPPAARSAIPAHACPSPPPAPCTAAAPPTAE